MDRRAFLTGLGACAAASNIGTPVSARESESVQASKRLQSDDGVVTHPFESKVMQGFPPDPKYQVTQSSFIGNPDYARWAAQHIEELFPTHKVGRGLETPFLIPRNDCDINKITVSSPGDTKMTVESLLRKLGTDAFLLIRNGEIISEQYFSGMTPHTPHALFSGVKSIIATVIATLLATGEIEVDRGVDEYVPELKNSGYAGSTVRQLLDMRSGVEWSQSSWEPYLAALGPAASEKSVPVGVYNFIPGIKKAAAGEKKAIYKNSDPDVLTWIAEKVTGVRFSDLLSQRLWSKLGMEHDARVSCDQLGHWAGVIGLTARDFARWGLLCLNEGSHRGEQLAPKNFFTDIRENALTGLDILHSRAFQNKTAYRSFFMCLLIGT